MAEIIIEGSGGDAGSEGERNIVLVAYILHACAVFTGLTAIVGVILNHLKVNDTQSAFIRSHHSWMLRTFWWGLLWAVICSVLMLVLVGAVGFLILGIWWIYRIVRGFLAYAERKPMPMG